MVLRIDSRLHVVADDTAAARHHRTGIRVGQRNLFIRGIVELSFDPLKLFHLRFELGDFIFQVGSVRISVNVTAHFANNVTGGFTRLRGV